MTINSRMEAKHSNTSGSAPGKLLEVFEEDLEDDSKSCIIMSFIFHPRLEKM